MRTAETGDDATRVPRDPMTRDQAFEHCRTRTMTNIENLSKIIGVGQNALYDSIARGEWVATRVVRVGRLIKIPTADIIDLIGSEA